MARCLAYARALCPLAPQRTRRPPKEMVPLKPEEFAAQLISRLESLKRQQDTLSCLEERLQQIQEVRTAAKCLDMRTIEIIEAIISGLH